MTIRLARLANRYLLAFACLSALAGLVMLRPALAAVPSSASFRIFGDGLNLMAGTASSSSFAVSDCLGPGPEAAGEASSASFMVQIGCVYALSPGLPFDDDDGDGISNGDENAAPNNGDGNGDGVADSTQGNVASLPAATGSGYVTVDIPPNGPCGQLLDVQAVDPSTLGDGDPGFIYPFGMVRFRIEPCAGPVLITLFLHGGGGFVDTYRMFGNMAPNFVSPPDFYTFPGATFGTTTVGMSSVRTVTFSLTDNLLGDDSPVALRIIELGGPARAVVNNVPVASTTGLVLCILLLGGVAAFSLRPRRE